MTSVSVSNPVSNPNLITFVSGAGFNPGGFTAPQAVFGADGLPYWLLAGGIRVPMSPGQDGKFSQKSKMFIGNLMTGERGRLGRIPWLETQEEAGTQRSKRLGAVGGVYFDKLGTQATIDPYNDCKGGRSMDIRKRLQVSSSCSPLPIHKLCEIPLHKYDYLSMEQALHAAFAHRRQDGEREKFRLTYFELHDLLMIRTERQLIRFIQAAASVEGRLLYSTLENALIHGQTAQTAEMHTHIEVAAEEEV